MTSVTQKQTLSFVIVVVLLIPGSCAFAQSPSCGQKDDGLVHIPPGYNSFTPPVEGQSYVDPQYGCTVTRLTNSMQDSPLVPRHHYYSTLTPFNANSSQIMVFLDSGSNEIRDLRGDIVVSTASMPGSNTGVEPWDPKNPSVFYYLNGNQFLKGTVSGETVSSTVLHTFSGFSQVNIPDEEDLTDDGTKIWLIGNPGNECAGTGILYNLATDTVVSQSLKLTSCHKVQIFPSGKMLCTNCNGNNITIYNTDGTVYWNPPYSQSAHAEVGTDLRGREVLISTANGTTSLNACADAWSSLTVVDINAKTPVNCLISGIPAWHVSYRDSASGWVALSFFDPNACPDYSCFFPQNLISTWNNLWAHYSEEVILVKIDGSAIQRLVHHRSRSAEYYWAQSHAAISRDGRFILFDSNMGISNSGFTSPNQYSDVYLTTALATFSSLLISPATATLNASESQTFSAGGGASPYAFSIVTNNSGGTIDAFSGAYIAGTKGGVTDTIRVTDNSSNTSNATVTVLSTLAISPQSASVNSGGSQTFSASGGNSPYSYSIVINNSGGTMNASNGAYTAGAKGGVADTVRVTDNAGNISNATVTVRGPLAISPASASVATTNTKTFSASGGMPPYSFSIVTNHSGGTINSSTGAYTAGANAGVTDTVRATDAAGTTSNATVAVTAATCSTITKIQVVSAASASTTSESVSLTETVGDLLVAAVYWNGSDVTAVSDRLGNVWNSIPVENNANTATDVRIWYAQNIKGGANAVTVTQPWSVSLGFYLIEYSGIATSGALDSATGKIASVASSVADAGNLTTSGCRDVVVGLFADTWGSGNMTPGRGWIIRGTDPNFYSMVVDNLPGGTGTLDPKAGLVGSNSDAAWSATTAAFKAKH
ncbi:MAG TPA: hypothetical protein VK699_21670 [Terriglobales bacterium]|jgi:hypothetical protein|nr:hypothetical protein [Terriglobales bacterium]